MHCIAGRLLAYLISELSLTLKMENKQPVKPEARCDSRLPAPTLPVLITHPGTASSPIYHSKKQSYQRLAGNQSELSVESAKQRIDIVRRVRRSVICCRESPY
jgi:hypothetical protein